MKTVVLCLGNPILGDDGVGLHIAKKLHPAVKDPDVTISEACIGGIRMLDLLSGYDRAIIVDAIQTRKEKPGHIYRFDRSTLCETNHTYSAHDIGLSMAIELGKTLGIDIPQRITLFAIEADDVKTFAENCTPAVNKAAKNCVKLILRELELKSQPDRSPENSTI